MKFILEFCYIGIELFFKVILWLELSLEIIIFMDLVLMLIMKLYLFIIVWFLSSNIVYKLCLIWDICMRKDWVLNRIFIL